MASTSVRRTRWRCPACFTEVLSTPPAPECGCTLPRWQTMEPVPPVRRPRRQRTVDAMRRGFAERDRSQGRSDYIGRPIHPAGW